MLPRNLAPVAYLVAMLIAWSSLVGVAQAYQMTAEASCTAPAAVVRDWVGAWKAKSFKRMTELSEVSWRRRTDSPMQTLRDQYGFKDVLSYRFVRCAANATSARVTFQVKYRTFKVSRVRIAAMVIREDVSGNPSPSGRWGVNPISTLRENPVP